MPEDPNKLYSVYKTTIWFAIASIVLAVSLVLMVFQDHGREWKHWQRKFIAFEREKLRAELEELATSEHREKLKAIEDQLKGARAKAAGHKAEQAALLREKENLQVPLVKAKTHFQDLKQYVDSYKFFLEEHRAHGRKREAAEYEQELKTLEPEFAKAKLKQEELEERLDEIDAKLQSFKADEAHVKKELTQLLRDQTQLERKLEKIDPASGVAKAAQEALNAPMLDFIAPSLQVQQIVLEDLEDDFYFAKSQKVDRCTTCHLAIDQKGFEKAPQPFRTHPKLDLFLGTDSPHPLEKIGCTVCHGGSGQSMSFVQAAHTPQSEEQEKSWRKEYRWHELKHWEAKMLPLQHTQASCTKCHQGVMEIPEAPKLNEGRRLAQQYGCFGCHTVKGFDNRWKVGPSLLNIQSKVERDWVSRWLQNPKSFRPSTQMPSIFHQENTNLPEDRAKSNVAIEGIAAYLMKNSESVSLATPPVKGNSEIGKKLVKDLGCLGCHSAEGVDVNHHGPELVHLGSKTSAEWLYTWLKDPKHISPDTRMPDLRLTDEEAAHITSFLLQDRNEKFEAVEIPEVTAEEVETFALDYMSRKMRRSEALEKLSAMDRETKLEFVGREMVLQQGCYGCHTIKGFETAKPIGTELTKEGQKEVDKLDFGFEKIEQTRQAWFSQKLKNPRIFDRGRIRDYHEKLRMPNFGFTDEQADALTTFLLSLREDDIPLEMQKRLNLKEQEIEAGRFLVSKFNCQGCHTLDGAEGRVRPTFEDPGLAPPILDGEGAKVQEAWLYRFLQSPILVRPWLHYRMPTFGLSDEATDILVKYFSNLAQQKISFAPKAIVPSTSKTIQAGRELFVKFKCIQCHQSGAEGLTASFLAPDLTMAHERLKPAWVVEWLKDPQALQAGTMMPSFFPDGNTPVKDVLEGDTLKQINAIKDYLMVFTPEEAEKIRSGNTSSQEAET